MADIKGNLNSIFTKNLKEASEAKTIEKPNQEAPITAVIKSDNISINLSNYNLQSIDELVEEIETKNRIKFKTGELIKVVKTSEIATGILLNEIFDLFGGEKYTSKYGKWLKAINFPQKTAYRLRKRATLYTGIKNITYRNYVIELIQRDVESAEKMLAENSDIFDEKDFKTFEEFREFIRVSAIEKIENKEAENIEINDEENDNLFLTTFDLYEKINTSLTKNWENYSYEKKKKIQNQLTKLEKLIVEKFEITGEIEEAETVIE